MGAQPSLAVPASALVGCRERDSPDAKVVPKGWVSPVRGSAAAGGPKACTEFRDKSVLAQVTAVGGAPDGAVQRSPFAGPGG